MRGRSLLDVTEDVRIQAGSALLRHAGAPLDGEAHRHRYGPLPRVDVRDLQALVAGVGLRGRGGAGFPFARKLGAVADRAGVARRPVVVVNASEGEPASAKDAALAQTAPHLVLDGAALSAAALGAREVHVVVPGDRPRVRALWHQAVLERDDRVRWHVHATEPRFVAGQSHAVLELLAGRPGLPVTAWQPAAVVGHRGRPTLLSNAETWAQVGRLALDGPRAVLAEGTAEEPGTTLLTLHLPGQPVTVVEAEHGTALGQLVPPSARRGPLLVGGFHGTWTTWSALATASVSPTDLQRRGVALGAGVVIALGPEECALGTTALIVEHLARQSAGRCGPCVNGLPALARSVAGLLRAEPGAHAEAARLTGLVAGRGACAHPDGTARLVGSLLTALPAEVDAHADGGCTGAGLRQEVAS